MLCILDNNNVLHKNLFPRKAVKYVFLLYLRSSKVNIKTAFHRNRRLKKYAANQKYIFNPSHKE